MSEDEQKIAVFRPLTDFPVAKRSKARCKCSEVGHPFPHGEAPPVWIDEATQDVECRRCGARLSAFDYLWYVATEGESLWNQVRRLREEKHSLEAQNKLLQEQQKELRSENRKMAKGKSLPETPTAPKADGLHLMPAN